ncbi:MAG TPA: ankyrin repeat domain-containing protein [Tepidisphaeraceae bacterium]|nr:ankyrin repeat domain-containing protein [Tepidisphaeraceae bacterium]
MPFPARMGIAFALILIGAASPAFSHETDQFTVPPDREFADLGPTLTRWAYRAIESGVARTNTRIELAIKAKRADSVERFQQPDEIAMAVNAAFPPALFSIEEWDKKVQSRRARERFPGRVVGYKPFIGVRKHAEFSLDPFRAWNCATIKAYGVYMGTDKLGHFTDMGKHYYLRYRKERAAGTGELRAMAAAISLGAEGGPVFFSESGFLGEKTAGAYSNADLVSNYMGMMFYRNLTDPVSLKGQLRAPMLVRDGPYWRINDHVRPDSHFFSLFFSHHFDEALNPSRYIDRLRDKIRKAIEEHASETIDRYVDAHGNRRPREYFIQRQQELSTYWGVNYGHKGNPDKDLLTIANTCFPSAPVELMKPEQRDGVGMTALHLAARDGDAKLVRDLIDRGADVNAAVRSGEKRSPEWGSTPLHYAVRDGHIEVAALLIEHGADVNAANDRGVTPLHRAIYNGETATLLVDAGARIDAPDDRGETPLHWAALDGAPGAMGALLASANAPVAAADHRGRTPLHVAAEVANEPAVLALLARNAKADAADRFGITPLHLASRNGFEFVATALLDAGAAPNAQDDFGVTPLHEATRWDSPAVVFRLLAANADPSVVDLYGTTPLHLAARHADASVAQLLLDAGADAMARAARRGTPIDEARRTKNRPVLALLRDARNQSAAQTASSAGE